MQRHAQQPPFTVGVHSQVEHHTSDDAVGHTFDLSTGLLGDQEVVGPDEGHRDRLIESADHSRHCQRRILEGLCASRDRLGDDGRADENGQRDWRRHYQSPIRCFIKSSPP